MRKRIRHLTTLICGFFVAVPALVGCGSQAILPTSITVTSESNITTIEVEDTLQLYAAVLPEEAEVKTVTWSSSDEEVATISESGLVTALAVSGNGVTLSATSVADQTIKGDFTLYIDPLSPNSITVTSPGDKTTLEIEETIQLTVNPSPSNANTDVTWSSSDIEIATVSETGLVTALDYSYDGVVITATSTSDDEITGSITLYVNAPMTNISAIRNLDNNTEVVITGVVSSFVYTGQSTPYITGMYVTDSTGCIYVYGENQAKSVSLYSTITVRGTKTYYIPETDTGSASAVNYRGALQLTSPVIFETDADIADIPETAITESDTLMTISDIPLSTDITGNLYRLEGRIRRVPGSGFVNYYLEDLNRIDSFLVYTQCNGKDFEYLDEYDGKAVSILVNVILGKPGVNAWRIYPTTQVEEIVVTDEQELDYGLYRAQLDIPDSFSEDVTITFNKVDAILPDMTRSIVSSHPNIAITENEDDFSISITIDSEYQINTNVTITVSYKGLEDSVFKPIGLVWKPAYEAITLAEARGEPDGSEVTIEAIVARFVFKSGSNIPMGAFIIDDTGSLFIYNDSNHMSSLLTVQEGNLIAATGTINHYISDSNTAKAAANNYSGDFQLENITLIHNDNGYHSVLSDAIEETTVQAITQTTGSTNLSGTIFEVTGVITKTVSPYYSTYYVKDTTQTYSLNVYSQKNGSEFGWLDDYLDTEVTLYLGIQNAKLSDTSLSWRVCPIAIL